MITRGIEKLVCDRLYEYGYANMEGRRYMTLYTAYGHVLAVIKMRLGLKERLDSAVSRGQISIRDIEEILNEILPEKG